MDGQSHPVLDGINNCYIHPILDGQSHPIMDGFNNCYILDGQSHQIMEVNDYLRKLDGQFHSFLDVYWSFCPSIGKTVKKKHPFLDENCSFVKIIQNWINVGRQ